MLIYKSKQRGDDHAQSSSYATRSLLFTLSRQKPLFISLGIFSVAVKVCLIPVNSSNLLQLLNNKIRMLKSLVILPIGKQ